MLGVPFALLWWQAQAGSLLPGRAPSVQPCQSHLQLAVCRGSLLPLHSTCWAITLILRPVQPLPAAFSPCRCQPFPALACFNPSVEPSIRPVYLQSLYTMGGPDNLKAARSYYAAAIEYSGGDNVRALWGVCMVSLWPSSDGATFP